MYNNRMLFKAFLGMFGVFVQSVGAALLNELAWGLDPYTSANVISSKLLGVNLGIYQLILNLLLFFSIICCFGKKSFGIGTVENMVFIGFFVEYFSSFLNHYHISKLEIPIKILILIIGISIFTLGVTIYMSLNIGVSPYDAFAPIISKKTSISFKTIRISQDIFFLMLTLILGGIVGIGTIALSLLSGPFISFWSNLILKLNTNKSNTYFS